MCVGLLTTTSLLFLLLSRWGGYCCWYDGRRWLLMNNTNNTYWCWLCCCWDSSSIGRICCLCLVVFVLKSDDWRIVGGGWLDNNKRLGGECRDIQSWILLTVSCILMSQQGANNIFWIRFLLFVTILFIIKFWRWHLVSTICRMCFTWFLVLKKQQLLGRNYLLLNRVV